MRDCDRESLGRIVRDAWIERCKLKPNPRPDHVAPWEEMPEFDRETDRVIAEAVLAHLMSLLDEAKETQVALVEALKECMGYMGQSAWTEAALQRARAALEKAGVNA